MSSRLDFADWANQFRKAAEQPLDTSFLYGMPEPIAFPTGPSAAFLDIPTRTAVPIPAPWDDDAVNDDAGDSIPPSPVLPTLFVAPVPVSIPAPAVMPARVAVPQLATFPPRYSTPVSDSNQTTPLTPPAIDGLDDDGPHWSQASSRLVSNHALSLGHATESFFQAAGTLTPPLSTASNPSLQSQRGITWGSRLPSYYSNYHSGGNNSSADRGHISYRIARPVERINFPLPRRFVSSGIAVEQRTPAFASYPMLSTHAIAAGHATHRFYQAAGMLTPPLSSASNPGLQTRRDISWGSGRPSGHTTFDSGANTFTAHRSVLPHTAQRVIAPLPRRAAPLNAYRSQVGQVPMQREDGRNVYARRGTPRPSLKRLYFGGKDWRVEMEQARDDNEDAISELDLRGRFLGPGGVDILCGSHETDEQDCNVSGWSHAGMELEDESMYADGDAF